MVEHELHFFDADDLLTHRDFFSYRAAILFFIIPKKSKDLYSHGMLTNSAI